MVARAEVLPDSITQFLHQRDLFVCQGSFPVCRNDYGSLDRFREVDRLRAWREVTSNAFSDLLGRLGATLAHHFVRIGVVDKDASLSHIILVDGADFQVENFPMTGL